MYVSLHNTPVFFDSKDRDGILCCSALFLDVKMESIFLQAYQHLFYLLQTNPNYFAKLIFEMPQSKTNRFMENVILTVFNYAQNNREQFLLIKLFERALKEEVE